ncbi:MAG TPA: DUF1294 domain-containing protein [Oribacterium sp.]|nr:DUF1294 domain-containing protein [Oribacterium sp.]HCS67508.1 DUF1294 domain-containing protein [Oribacterium sp.]
MQLYLDQILVGWVVLMSILSFLLYGVDKYKAIHHRWRVPEQTLLLSAFLGGAPGALLGMQLFHHKTRKWKFRLLVPVALVLWIIVFGKIYCAGVPMEAWR